MKLYDKLPDTVTVKGKKVKVNLDFKNVLRMIDILEQDDLLPEVKEYLALKCICRRPVDGMMEAVINLLFPRFREHDKITDYTQDADLIRAAFRQVYGIDLYKVRLHWFEFSCLLACIPEGTRYGDVLSIRARPIPAATPYNQKEIEWLRRAKAEVALKLTETERLDKYHRDVENIGAFLLALAEEGE